MTKKEQIFELFRQGKTIKEIEGEGVASNSYIRRARSLFRYEEYKRKTREDSIVMTKDMAHDFGEITDPELERGYEYLPEDKYRFEEIDGKKCIILQSAMNELK